MTPSPRVLALSFTLLAALVAVPASASMQSATGIAMGINGGMGATGSITVYDFAKGFPFSARIGASLLSLDAGDALLARQVFINNATNGTPDKTAHRWDVRVDLRHQIRSPGRLNGMWLYFGPRVSMFNATFDYIGGNEVFDVTCNQWGAGGGLEALYPISQAVNLSVDLGLDGYANGKLSGHDTTYSPDGTNVNPIANYGYADANQAINQPRLVPRVMVGLVKRLGR
jgi:hypothetical protein